MPPPSLLRRPVRVLVALAALLVLVGCEANTAPAPKSERPVQIRRVSFENADRARDFVGVVRPRYETDLGFRVAGKIVTRIVNVGDRVAIGDVVARLDPEDLRLQVQSAEAEIAAATSNLAQAAADFERYSKLKTNGWASVADFDRKKAASDEAQGRLDRARRALDLARNQLTYADLKADADGVITATLAEPGQVVAIGQAVARLATMARRKPSSRCRRPGSPRHASQRRSCDCGRTASAASRRDCASFRRRPTPRPAPMPRASPSKTQTTRSPLA